MCDTHPVHGISVPYIDYAEWSLVVWSFRIMFFCVEKDCFKLTNNNNNNNNNDTCV